MSVFISSLNSGSNGNCYYVGNQHEAVLVDVGISCREVERRMQRLGLSMQKVKAILVSHEHSDHIRGISVLARKYQLPVYITQGTLQYAGLDLPEVIFLKSLSTITIGDLRVTTFPKAHDAYDPHSFVISFNEINIGVFTDIGQVCEQVINYFKQCHAVFLEANYDEVMLDKGRYPYYLKNRIRGGRGHLSNREALQLFINHRPQHLSHLLLSHLSQDNNCPDLVYNLFNQHANGVYITVASRHAETPVYCIKNNVTEVVLKPEQLALSFG